MRRTLLVSSIDDFITRTACAMLPEQWLCLFQHLS
jgi:hypothetical protein